MKNSAELPVQAQEKTPAENIAILRSYFEAHPKFKNYLSAQRDTEGDVDKLSELNPEQYNALQAMWAMMPDTPFIEPGHEQGIKWQSHFGVPEVDIQSEELPKALSYGIVKDRNTAITVTKRDRLATDPRIDEDGLEALQQFSKEDFTQAEKDFDSGLESVREIISDAGNREQNVSFGNLTGIAQRHLRFFENIPMNMISPEIASTLHITKCNLATYIDLINEIEEFRDTLPEVEPGIFHNGDKIAEKFGKKLYTARTTLQNLFRLLKNQQQTLNKKLAETAKVLE
jgi:hypothetical protein